MALGELADMGDRDEGSMREEGVGRRRAVCPRSPPVLPDRQAGAGARAHVDCPWSAAPQPAHLWTRPPLQGLVQKPLLKLRQTSSESRGLA